MSYINPTPSTPAQLVDLDYYLDRLRSYLLQLGWLEICHGRAYRETEQRGRQTYYRPIVYQGNGKYEEVDFNKNVNSQCFFYVRDPMDISNEVESYQPNGERYSKFDYNLDVIFLYNQDKVKKMETRYNFPQRIDEIMKHELFELMDNVDFYRIQRVYQTSDEVFRDFSKDHTKSQTFMYPYGGLKLRGLLTVNKLCTTGIPGLDGLDFELT
jgi:hypothetical protein